MSNLLVYTGFEDAPTPVQNGSRKYHGAAASGYDAKREFSPKWAAEDRLVKSMLADQPKGSWILDCPVGTGRFLPYYKDMGFLVRAFDISEDMLEQAKQKAFYLDFPSKKILVQGGDVRELPVADKSCDASVMVRLTRWLSPEDCQLAMLELQRVTRKRIIFTARVANHVHARPLSLFEEVLDGWKISRNEAAGEEHYRVICLEPT